MSRAWRYGRGRARGGGGNGYRPYFFRRNGRVIPAGGQQDDHGADTSGNFGRGRGWKNRAPGAAFDDGNNVESTFLRPEHFAAPEGAFNINSITALWPPQCPGWRLYFLKEEFNPTSELVKRIKVIETHFRQDTAHYDLSKIAKNAYFALHANVVMGDENVKAAWPQMLLDMSLRPQQTMATFGAAMHAAVSASLLDMSVNQATCRSDYYAPRYARARKIYVRPVGFVEIGSMANLDNSKLDSLCCVRGTVVAVSSVEAAASWISFKCGRCNLEQAARQTGVQVTRPYGCKNNECPAKKGFVEQRSSPFTRVTPVQIVRLVETAATTATIYGHDARELIVFDVEVRHDMVDLIAPGQNVVITGIPKMHPLADGAGSSRTNSKTADVFKVFVKALSIMDGKFVPHKFNEADIEHITAINCEQNNFKLLVNSLAPEVHGQEMAKAGLLLSLFGGSGSQLHDEGDIHVLLVGDPGIGKSHTLQMCSKIIEKGTTISGKGNTANKLIASIQGRHQNFLQSGAIVSSSNGHCTIDDIDRLAAQQDLLLQVMQSRNIVMPFAGIYVTLATPTSVIATANSTRGHYDHGKLLTENIRITPTLLSEFHLVFVLTDKPSKCSDASLTEHVRAKHDGAKRNATIAARFAGKPKTNTSISSNCSTSSDVPPNDNLEQRLKSEPFEQLDLLPAAVMKKFICYARQQVRPLLSIEAADLLKSFYLQLREEKSEQKVGMVNTSQLEGLIRFCQARARIDFASAVTKEHVYDVMCIVRQSIADTSLGDYMDLNPASATGGGTVGVSRNKLMKRFMEVLQMRAESTGRKIFDYDELKEMAQRVGIMTGLTAIIEIVNVNGFLLKKGPNMYEVMAD